MNNIGPNIFPNPTPNNGASSTGRAIFQKVLEQARVSQTPQNTQTQIAAPKANPIIIPDEAPKTNIRKGMVLDIRV